MACMRLARQETVVEEGLATRRTESFFGTANWMRKRQIEMRELHSGEAFNSAAGCGLHGGRRR